MAKTVKIYIWLLFIKSFRLWIFVLPSTSPYASGISFYHLHFRNDPFVFFPLSSGKGERFAQQRRALHVPQVAQFGWPSTYSAQGFGELLAVQLLGPARKSYRVGASSSDDEAFSEASLHLDIVSLNFPSCCWWKWLMEIQSCVGAV